MTPKKLAEAPRPDANRNGVAPKTLTPAEAWGLEKSQLLLELRQAESENIILRKAHLAASSKNVENAIIKDERALAENKIADARIRTKLLTEIKERLGLKSTTFGYKPDSLEVVED